MKLAMFLDILFQYGLPVLVAFFAWLQRKLEKPKVEHQAAQSVVTYLKETAHTQAAKATIEQSFQDFLNANPKIKPKRKR